MGSGESASGLPRGGLAAVILAAGKGTRMGSDRAKVLHEVGGRPMIVHVIDAARAAGCDPVVAVIGCERGAVREAAGGEVRFAVQDEQLGTGHAVRCAEPALAGGLAPERVVVLSGDVPLIRAGTIAGLCRALAEAGAAAGVLSMHVEGENRYGRIVRDAGGRFERIVEHKDATDEERKITEVNAGTYCFQAEHLFDALRRISNVNAQGEYYLTDVIGLLAQDGKPVIATPVEDAAEVMGVDTPEALERARTEFKARSL